MPFVPLNAGCAKLPSLSLRPNSLSNLQNVERIQNNGSLSEIDALISCDIVSFQRETIAKFEDLSESSKYTVLNQLFFTLNWFREVRELQYCRNIFFTLL